MFWMLVLLAILGFVFFKLGVYSVLLAMVQLLAKVIFIGSGLFLMVYAARWVLNRRRVQHAVRVEH